MDQFFREVDDELKRDNLNRLWRRYGIIVITVAVAIVAITASYKGWQYYTTNKAESMGDRFIVALDSSQSGAAETALLEIAENGSGSYPVLARFRLAGQYAHAGEKNKAIAEFKTIATDSAVAKNLQHLAAIRQAMLAIDEQPVENIEEILLDAQQAGEPFSLQAREILAIAIIRAGQLDKAKEIIEAISDNVNASREMRQRMNILLTWLNSEK